MKEELGKPTTYQLMLGILKTLEDIKDELKRHNSLYLQNNITNNTCNNQNKSTAQDNDCTSPSTDFDFKFVDVLE